MELEPRRMAAVGAAALAVLASGCGGSSQADPLADPSWQQEFAGLGECDLESSGKNDYFILEPGFRLALEGGGERLEVTVLDETKVVTSVTTRVVEEREWRSGELIEISRNFVAICPSTKDVFYFGEEVDDYRDGQVVGHGGAWLAGESEARAGLIMPGTPAIGMGYYQEVAPGVALDRARVLSLDETIETPAGPFSGSLLTEEDSALKPGVTERKTYAPGIGIVQDQRLLLTEYGFVETA